MPPVTATLGGRHQAAVTAATNAKNAQENPEYNFIGDANTIRQVNYYVYIFNVSEVEVRIERPWVSYNPAQQSRMIVIPACEAGQRVSKPFKIADVVQVPLRNDSTKMVTLMGQKGEFLAQDAVNPEDPTGNWKTMRELGIGQSFNEGVNLYHWGLFWTRNETPTDEEVATARRRLTANYNRLINEAKMLWAGGEQKRLEIGATHRRAASHFKLEFPWNTLYTEQKQCPQCGTAALPTSVVCVNSTCPVVFDWDQALAFGLRTIEQAIAAGVMDPETTSKKRAAKSA